MAMPQDLKIAYETFTMLALKHGYLYAALMIGTKPLDPLVIGNVNERGHALANLLRMHADYIDKQTDAGNTTTTPEMPSNVN
jgi:hypothetical protein